MATLALVLGGLNPRALFAQSFGPAQNSFTGTLPTCVKAADFDGDGKLDLVIGRDNAAGLAILLGNGDGTFQPATNLTAGSRPLIVDVADFDGDGKMDIVAANYGDNAISVLLGNGNGTFKPAVNYAVGTNPRSVAAGNLNGKMGIVVVNVTDNSVSVLVGNGDGTFKPAVSYPVGQNPLGVALGDFNGDGKLDIVTANYIGNSVSILLGNGDGTFQTATSVSAGTNPSFVAVGDFNNDGISDLAVTNANGNNVSILLGNGNGTFQATPSLSVGSDPRTVAVADFNHDGHSDLAVTNFNDGNVSDLRGIGAGTFQPAVNHSTGAGAEYVLAADFNADGFADLAVVNENAGTVSILLNLRTPLTVTAMSPSPGTTLTASPSSIVLTLSAPIDPASANALSVQLIRAGPDGIFGTADDLAIAPTAISAVNGNQISLDLSGLFLVADKYKITLSSPVSPTSNGLAAFWTFDEASGTTVADSSGNNNTGTLNGGTNRVLGLAKNAVKFDAPTFGAMKVTRNSTLEPTTAITVSVWGNITDAMTGNVGDLLRKSVPQGTGYLLRWSSGPGKLEWRIDNGGNSVFAQNPQSNTLYLNSWHHYAGTYDGSTGLCSLYVDGALTASASGTPANLQHSDDLYMMDVNYGSQIGVPGTLEDFRIYGRALSAAEIAILAKRGILDTSGNALDGEYSGTFPSGNGTAGGDFSAQFQIVFPPLTITDMSPAPGSAHNLGVNSVLMTLSNNIDSSSVNSNSIVLKSAGPDGIIDTADDVTVTPAAVTVVNGKQVKVDLPAQTKASDSYQITLNGSSPQISSTEAYFKFDDGSGMVALDSSGNGNTASWNGTPGWTAGKVGGALSLSSSSYLTVNNTAVGNFGTGDFSVSFWVNTQTKSCIMLGNRYSSFHSEQLSNDVDGDVEIMRRFP